MRFFRCSRGQAMVEFALVAPVLIFLLVAMMVFGITLNSKLVVTGAAREGGRYYAVHSSEPDVAAETRNKVRQSLENGGLPVTPERFNPASDVQISDSGDYVYVTVRYRQPTFAPNTEKLLSSSAQSWGSYFTLQSTAVFRKEQ